MSSPAVQVLIAQEKNRIFGHVHICNSEVQIVLFELSAVNKDKDLVFIYLEINTSSMPLIYLRNCFEIGMRKTTSDPSVYTGRPSVLVINRAGLKMCS